MFLFCTTKFFLAAGEGKIDERAPRCNLQLISGKESVLSLGAIHQ
jgi:hypothetical protein